MYCPFKVIPIIFQAFQNHHGATIMANSAHLKCLWRKQGIIYRLKDIGQIFLSGRYDNRKMGIYWPITIWWLIYRASLHLMQKSYELCQSSQVSLHTDALSGFQLPFGCWDSWDTLVLHGSHGIQFMFDDVLPLGQRQELLHVVCRNSQITVNFKVITLAGCSRLHANTNTL